MCALARCALWQLVAADAHVLTLNKNVLAQAPLDAAGVLFTHQREQKLTIWFICCLGHGRWGSWLKAVERKWLIRKKYPQTHTHTHLSHHGYYSVNVIFGYKQSCCQRYLVPQTSHCVNDHNLIIIIINIKDRPTDSIGFSPVVVREAAVGDSSQHEGEHTVMELNWLVGLFKWLRRRQSQLCYSNDRCWTTETTVCILLACLSPSPKWVESNYSNDSN